jgi:hypothetical protein
MDIAQNKVGATIKLEASVMRCTTGSREVPGQRTPVIRDDDNF